MDIRSLITRLGYKVDTRGLKTGEKAVGRYARNIKRIAMVAIAGVGAAILGVGVSSVSAAAKMESINASFEVMLGSKKAADDLVESINTMADATPFQGMDLAQQAKMMLNMGIATKDVMGNLQMLGDIAGNDVEKLKSLTRAFGQMSSAGRLTGEDLNQMIDAGFNPLMIIAQRGGGGADAISKRYQKLRDEMSKGKISVEAIKGAFKEVTSEGGRFYQNMLKQSQTLGGRWSTFLGMVSRLRVIIGKYLNPVLGKLLKVTNEWLLKTAIPATKAWFASLQPLLFFFEDLWFVIKLIPEMLRDISKAFRPEIELVKELVSTAIDLFSAFGEALFAVSGGLLGAADSSGVFSFAIDAMGHSLRFVIQALKMAVAGYKMLAAVASGNFSAVADIDAQLDKDLDALFSQKEGAKASGDRLAELKENFTKGFKSITSALEARKSVRVTNIKVEQNNTIKAPAAKDGTTGLSADGLDQSLRKAQKSLWAGQLNKLTTASIGT